MFPWRNSCDWTETVGQLKELTAVVTAAVITVHKTRKTSNYKASNSGLFLVTFLLCMCTNCYFKVSDPNSDIAIRFDNPDFLYGTDIFATGGHLSCDLDLQHVSYAALRTGIIFTQFELGQLISSWPIIFILLTCYITLWLDLWPFVYHMYRSHVTIQDEHPAKCCSFSILQILVTDRIKQTFDSDKSGFLLYVLCVIKPACSYAIVVVSVVEYYRLYHEPWFIAGRDSWIWCIEWTRLTSPWHRRLGVAPWFTVQLQFVSFLQVLRLLHLTYTRQCCTSHISTCCMEKHKVCNDYNWQCTV